MVMKKYSILLLLTLFVSACGGGGDDPDEINVRKDKITIAEDRIDLLGDKVSRVVSISVTCDWVITEDIDWLTVSPRNGTKSTTSIEVSVSRNTDGKVRSGSFFISGGDAQTVKVTVTQAKYSEDPIVKTLTTNTTSLSFEAKEESKSFTINSNTSWTISKPEWCAVSASSGNGNADIVVTAADNPNKEQRTGQIVISGEGVSSVTISVSQKGKDTTNSQEPGPNDNQPPS